MTEQHIERIARGLSKAQRRLVCLAEDIDYLVSRREARTGKVLEKMQIGRCVSGFYFEQGRGRVWQGWYWNTPIGLKVRAYLQEQGE